MKRRQSTKCFEKGQTFHFETGSQRNGWIEAMDRQLKRPGFSLHHWVPWCSSRVYADLSLLTAMAKLNRGGLLHQLALIINLFFLFSNVAWEWGFLWLVILSAIRFIFFLDKDKRFRLYCSLSEITGVGTWVICMVTFYVLVCVSSDRIVICSVVTVKLATLQKF